MHAYEKHATRGTSIAYISLSYKPCRIHVCEMYAYERHSHKRYAIHACDKYIPARYFR